MKGVVVEDESDGYMLALSRPDFVLPFLAIAVGGRQRVPQLGRCGASLEALGCL